VIQLRWTVGLLLWVLDLSRDVFVSFFKTKEEAVFVDKGDCNCDVSMRGYPSVLGAVSASVPAVGWSGCSSSSRDSLLIVIYIQ
jgi:hypothetical protein